MDKKVIKITAKQWFKSVNRLIGVIMFNGNLCEKTARKIAVALTKEFPKLLIP